VSSMHKETDAQVVHGGGGFISSLQAEDAAVEQLKLSCHYHSFDSQLEVLSTEILVAYWAQQIISFTYSGTNHSRPRRAVYYYYSKEIWR